MRIDPQRTRTTVVRRLLGVVAVCVVTAGGVLTAPSPAGAASTFSASAAAELARTLVHAEPALLQADLLDPGASSVQASMTSFGDSMAFASNPYPGSLVVSLPGTIDGVLAMTPGIPPQAIELLNLPDYPLIASSSYPATPSSSVGLGPVQLTANSRQLQSWGVATDGANRSEAWVTADPVSDVVTATAMATVGHIDLGPFLRISGVRGSATAIRTPGGDVQRRSDFRVASLTILGHSVAVTENGLELEDDTLAPGLSAVTDPLDELLASLAAQGFSIRFIPATNTSDGIISAGLEITRAFDTGVNGIVVTLQSTIGRTAVAVSNRARTSSSPFEGAVPPVVPPGGSFFFVPGSVSPPAPTPPPPGTTPGVSGPTRQIGLVPELLTGARFYWVLVVAGLMLAGSVTLFRKLGVRPSWIS